MQTLSQITNIFHNYLETNRFTKEPSELYAPVNYILSLGGKRIRPALLLMSYQLFKDDIEKALPAAMAIEVFHNFTLLHDDIMDEAPLRRGKATVHEKYDTNTAILSGDVMMIYAYQFLSELEDRSKLPELLEIFNKVAIEVCEGQQYDMNFEQRSDVKIEEYIRMIALKTSVLLGGAMKMGAVLAGASSEEAEQIYQFGLNIGIAFQLQDDLLDTFGDPKKFGKKVGGDIIQNKKTFLILKALQEAKGAEEESLRKLYESTDLDESSKVEKVKHAFNQLNISELTEDKKNTYLNTAFENLDKIKLEEGRKKSLRELAVALASREK